MTDDRVSLSAPPAPDEIATLTELLLDTDQRLAQLLSPEVSSVTAFDGRTINLRRAQQSVSEIVAKKQADILSAFPANMVLVDRMGTIVSVNEAWRQFGRDNAFGSPLDGVGLNYLDVCDQARGADAHLARKVAVGIRQVISGEVAGFTIEYPCHAPGTERWFQLLVSPLAGNRPGSSEGFIVMHLDISQRKRVEDILAESRTRLRFLGELAIATQSLVDGTQIMRTTCRMLAEHLDSSGCTYAETDDDGECTRIVDESRDGGRMPIDIHGLSSLGRHAIATLHRGRSMVVHDVADELADCNESKPFDLVHARALVCCPLLSEGRLRATITVRQAANRNWKASEVTAIEEALERSWSLVEQRAGQQRLHESEALLRIAGRTARLGGWSVELTGERVVWSDGVCEILAVPPGTAPALARIFDFCTPQSAAGARLAFDNCLETGASFDIELEMLTATGQRIWGRCTGEARFDAAGAINGVHGALQDITAQRHADSDHRLLAAIVESTSDLVSVNDATGRVLYLNRAGRKALGVDPDEDLSHRLAADFVIGPPTQPVLSEGIRTAISNGIWSGETLLRTREGKELAVSQVVVAHKGADGRLESVSTVMRDISERKRAEQELARNHRELRQQRSELRILFDLVPAMIWFKDADDVIVRLNQRAADATGAPVEAIEGRTSAEVYPDRVAQFRAEDMEIVRSGMPKLGTLNAATDLDGKSIWVETDKVPYFDERGKAIGIVVMAQDITERKRNHDALRELNAELEARVLSRTDELTLARDEAQQASRAKSAFLATMSHEIRTPMNGVIGMTEVLQLSGLTSRQLEMVELIRDSGFSLLAIIEDLLDFSKIEAGKLTLEAQPLCLGDVLERVCSMLDFKAIKRDVRMTVFVDPAIPEFVSGDASRLRQVFVNLVGNAIKFSSGRVQCGQVSVRAVLVEREAGHVIVELTVADNGIGLETAAMAQLFKPFSQADVSTTRRFGGTGLGLAISRMMVQLMSGEISVESEVDKGSTFTVRLRFATPAMALAIVADDDVSSLAKGLRCRVVGTERPMGDDVCTSLQHAGVRVERSPDLDAAAIAAGDSQSGLWLWLVLPDQGAPDLTALRAKAPQRAGTETRFLVLGWGTRRSPNVEADDLVTVDVDSLGRRTLFRSLALASGRLQEVPVKAEAAAAVLTPHTPSREETRRKTSLILIAEDNETNRTVILQQLRLIGYAADVAVDGRQALERWRSGSYALVLTDLHMPVMDGYALTAAIRSEEPAWRRTPIIALTANALRNEELRCRAAGMDAYLSKPALLAELKAAIDTGLGLTEAGGAAPEMAAPSVRPGPPVDLGVLTALIGEDRAAFEQVIGIFQKSAAQSRQELALALSRASMRSVSDAAHKLKSAACSIGANRLGALCGEIERTAETAHPAGLEILVAGFDAEADAVLAFLATK